MKMSLLMGVCFFCAVPNALSASAPANLDTQVQQLKQMVLELQATVQSQQEQIRVLQGGPAFLAPHPKVLESTKSAKPKWLPDVGVIADVVAKVDSPKADEEGADRVSVRELELVMGSAVDPYSRLDVTLSFSDFEEASLEEAYLTRFELPWEWMARVGRLKPRIGKAIPTHRDGLETVDEPLVIQRYFGAEGYNKTGLDFQKNLDFPWGSANQISFGLLEGGNGEGGTLFGSARRTPTFYSHYKFYSDLSDWTGLELGVSYLTGSRDADESFETNVLGLDTTWIHQLGDQRAVKVQAESFWVSRAESFVETADDASGNLFYDDLDDNRHLWGHYLLLDWRWAPGWASGFRWDHVQLVDDPVSNPNSADVAYTGYLTFYQSEFARWRVQFTRVGLSSGDDDHQVMLQGTFAIGEHKHKIQ